MILGFFILGLLIGSFLNVVVYRLPLGQSVAAGRSQCPQCSKQIHWFDNIPLLSWILLRGKCRACKKRITFQYPLVELITGVLFAGAYYRWCYPGSPDLLLFLQKLPFITLLIPMVFIDLEHRIIPDELTLGGVVWGLGTAWLPGTIGIQSALIGCILGFGIFYGFAWLYEKYKGISGLGGGDIKLLAMIGAYLGFTGVFSVIFISSILGSVAGILWALKLKKSKTLLQVAIPYGPFLVIAALYQLFFGEFLWHPFTKPM